MKLLLQSLIILALTLLLTTSSAQADSKYYTRSSVLKSFFPKSDKVGFTEFTPSKVQRATLKRQLGYGLAKQKYYFYVATTGDRVDGYAFIDDEIGLHLPITFAVKLSESGVVLRQEIMVYRESRGDDVRNIRFRKQFVGKTVHDSLRPNHDIDCISGATISSRAIALGVRRALVLFHYAVPRTRNSSL